MQNNRKIINRNYKQLKQNIMEPILRFENELYKIEELHEQFFFFNKNNQFDTKCFYSILEAYDYLFSL